MKQVDLWLLARFPRVVVITMKLSIKWAYYLLVIGLSLITVGVIALYGLDLNLDDIQARPRSVGVGLIWYAVFWFIAGVAYGLFIGLAYEFIHGVVGIAKDQYRSIDYKLPSREKKDMPDESA